MINNPPGLNTPDLQTEENRAAAKSQSGSLRSQDSSIGVAASLTALATLPILAAQAAPVAASAAPSPLTNERVRPITFTPVIDGAYPLEPQPIFFKKVDFED